MGLFNYCQVRYCRIWQVFGGRQTLEGILLLSDMIWFDLTILVAAWQLEIWSQQNYVVQFITLFSARDLGMRVMQCRFNPAAPYSFALQYLSAAQYSTVMQYLSALQYSFVAQCLSTLQYYLWCSISLHYSFYLLEINHWAKTRCALLILCLLGGDGQVHHSRSRPVIASLGGTFFIGWKLLNLKNDETL